MSCFAPNLYRVLSGRRVLFLETPNLPLSKREKEILVLIAEGKSAKEIAWDLHISVKTAATHKQNIREKLNIHNTAGLVRYAIRMGMIQP